MSFATPVVVGRKVKLVVRQGHAGSVRSAARRISSATAGSVLYAVPHQGRRHARGALRRIDLGTRAAALQHPDLAAAPVQPRPRSRRRSVRARSSSFRSSRRSRRRSRQRHERRGLVALALVVACSGCATAQLYDGSSAAATKSPAISGDPAHHGRLAGDRHPSRRSTGTPSTSARSAVDAPARQRIACWSTAGSQRRTASRVTPSMRTSPRATLTDLVAETGPGLRECTAGHTSDGRISTAPAGRATCSHSIISAHVSMCMYCYGQIQPSAQARYTPHSASIRSTMSRASSLLTVFALCIANGLGRGPAAALRRSLPPSVEPALPVADTVHRAQGGTQAVALRHGEVLRTLQDRARPASRGPQGCTRATSARPRDVTADRRNPNSEFFLSIQIDYPNEQRRGTRAQAGACGPAARS